MPEPRRELRLWESRRGKPRCRWCSLNLLSDQGGKTKILGSFFHGVNQLCCISFQGSHKEWFGCECFLVWPKIIQMGKSESDTGQFLTSIVDGFSSF